MEALFVALMESLRPKPEFLALFRAIVLDVWGRRQADAGRLRMDMARRIEALQRREAALDETFIFERGIDRATYERQRDRVRQDIALARIEEEDARIEEIDVEGLLGFSEHVLSNASRLWMEASPDQRQRLQRVLFPEGLRWKGAGFGTAVTSLAFSELSQNLDAKNDLASQGSSSWNQIAAFLGTMRRLRDAGIAAP